MRALDTNLVIRLLTADDRAQHATALALLGRPVWLPITVLIEAGSVLQSRYGFDRVTLTALFMALFDYPTINVQADEHVRWALSRYAVAGDLADLLHIAGACAAEADTFATFDPGIARAAGSDTPLRVETLA